MDERQTGYYWVLYQTEWRVAYWYRKEWWLTKGIGKYTDRHFSKIGERIPDNETLKKINHGTK